MCVAERKPEDLIAVTLGLVHAAEAALQAAKASA